MRDRLEEIIGKLPPDDGGILGDCFGGDESVETRHERILQRRRNRERGQRPCEFVVSIKGFEMSRFKNGFGHFLDEEWDPVGLGNHLVEHLWWYRFPVGHAVDNLCHLGMG